MDTAAKCCNDKKICSIHSYRSLDELTYRIKQRLNFLSREKLNNLFYNYKCAADIDTEIKKLTSYKEVLDRTKTSFLHIQKSCNDDETIQRIIEKVNKLIGKTACPKRRADIVIDESGLQAYLLTGPRCISYSAWNEFSRGICGKIGFTLTVEKQICDITYEISKKIIPCDLLYSLKVKRELCDLGYVVKRTDQECRLDWKLLVEKTNCDLDFKVYLSYIRKHNLSYPILEQVYAAGLSLTTVEDDVILCTPLNNYSLSEITPTDLRELLDAGFVVETNRYDIKSDYTKW